VKVGLVGQVENVDVYVLVVCVENVGVGTTNLGYVLIKLLIVESLKDKNSLSFQDIIKNKVSENKTQSDKSKSLSQLLQDDLFD
jgi:hypothetical protein